MKYERLPPHWVKMTNTMASSNLLWIETNEGKRNSYASKKTTIETQVGNIK